MLLDHDAGPGEFSLARADALYGCAADVMSGAATTRNLQRTKRLLFRGECNV